MAPDARKLFPASVRNRYRDWASGLDEASGLDGPLVYPPARGPLGYSINHNWNDWNGDIDGDISSDILDTASGDQTWPWKIAGGRESG